MTGLSGARSRGQRTGWVAACVIGIAVVWIGAAFGLWWITVLAGLAIGLIVPRGRGAFGASALAGLLGWALPLAVAAVGLPIGRAASVVAGIMGFGTANGALVIVLTLLLGLLLCLSGAWIGVALRRLPPQGERRKASLTPDP